MGENYQSVLAHFGEGTHRDPTLWDRTLGDLVTPSRPGGVVSIVNAATRESGTDAADWSIRRLVQLVATLERQQD